MDWIQLHDPSQLEELKKKSFLVPQVIFKHSTRCSISSMAKSRLERANNPGGIDFYYLDLIRNRSLSNRVAEEFGVWHESPQILLIVDGECRFDESHNGISMDNIITSIAQ